MSVRATQRIVGDIVITSGLSKSPPMIVQSVDEEAKMISTIWFSDNNEYQEGLFPANALDRAEPREPQTSKKEKTASGRSKKSSK